MAEITIRRKTGASTYEPLYPTTTIAQVINLQTNLDAKINTTARGAANGVASLGSDGKVPYSELPSAVTGGMRFYNTADLSAGTNGSPIELSTLWSSIANHANFSTTGGQSVGSYIIVTATGWIKDTSSVTGTSSGYYFYTPNGTALGEEGDNTTPYLLEKGDWIVMRSAFVPAANVTAYSFAIINNTYQEAGDGTLGIVQFGQYSTTQDLDDTTVALRASDLFGFLVGGDLNGAGDGIAMSNHTHSQYLLTSGTAAAATKWATARSITLTGGVTGTVTGVDGTGNVSIATTVTNGSHTHTLANITDVTSSAAELNVLDGIPGTLTATELGYVDGVTSSIQTQLNGKQATITGGATTITSSNLTASRALASDSNGKVAVSTVTSTELSYVSGVTSAIQTQLNNKAASVHNHDDLYYTETEINTFLDGGMRPPVIWDTAKTTADTATYPIGTIILDDDSTSSGY